MIYRIVLTIGYKELSFDFDDPAEAVNFVNSTRLHYVPGTDSDGKPIKISLMMQFLEAEDGQG